jgi:archaetidylinositol phosphate synthase
MTKIALKRWNEGVFQPWERPVLAWLAAHMPRWVTPDVLTFAGVIGAIVTFVGYAFSGSHPELLWIATLGLAINWFGDSLDGTLARFRNIERPRYGYYLDNAIDCLAALLLAFGLGLSGYVRFDVCFLGLSTYTMISALTFLRANVTNDFQISYGGIGPTEVRVGFAVLNALIIIFPPTAFDLFGITLKYPDVMSIAWSAMTVITFVVCMTKQVRQLAIEEPARQHEPSLGELAELAVSSTVTLTDGMSALAAGEARGPSPTMARAH